MGDLSRAMDPTMTFDAVELVGYLASALVVLSLTMTSLLRLRLISLVGSVTFAAYGMAIGSMPVLVTNGAIALINLHHLRRLWAHNTARSYFEVLPVPVTSPLLHRFLEFHAEDVHRFQPAFAGMRGDHLAWMVLRDGVPVGLVLGRVQGGTLHLDVDYVLPEHRDLQPGVALHHESSAFADLGATHVTSAPGSPAHQRYLARVGFAEDGAVWTRAL